MLYYFNKGKNTTEMQLKKKNDMYYVGRMLWWVQHVKVVCEVCAGVCGVTKSWIQLNDWMTTIAKRSFQTMLQGQVEQLKLIAVKQRH